MQIRAWSAELPQLSRESRPREVVSSKWQPHCHLGTQSQHASQAPEPDSLGIPAAKLVSLPMKLHASEALHGVLAPPP